MNNLNMPSLKVPASNAFIASEPCPNAILKPNAAYLAATTKINIAGLPYGSLHDCITDGNVTVNFSTPLRKLGPVPAGWSTWSDPPFSESATPDVLVTGEQSTLTMDLSEAVSIFGFELEPNSFETFAYTADFYRGGALVDSITRNVAGDAGARLFARSGEPIDRVVVSGPDSFAIAQVRLQQVIQAEGKVLLLLGSLLLLLVVPPFLL